MKKFPSVYFAFALICLLTLPLRSQTIDNKYVAEIRELTGNQKVKSAFDFIEQIKAQTRRDHIMLNEIAAPPFKEQKRAEKFAELLRAAGADEVKIDGAGNVVALRKGRIGNKTIALSAHLDTVFPEGTDVTVKVRGDTLFAPGIGDDTRGLIVILTILRALEKAGIETGYDVLFIGTVGEEGLGDLRGVKYLFGPEGQKIDSWVAVDGSGFSSIVHRALGSQRYRITFKGPGGHSWGAFGVANPQHALGTAISYFVEEADKFTSEGERTSYNVGRIGGGTSINSVPYDAWMEIDMRSVSPERLKAIDKILIKAVKRALAEQNEIRRKGPELTVEIDAVGSRPSGETKIETPILQCAMAAVKHFGGKPSLSISSTDSNIPISMGIPAITIGRGGRGGGGHSLDEWWLDINGHIAIQYALLILLSEGRLVR